MKQIIVFLPIIFPSNPSRGGYQLPPPQVMGPPLPGHLPLGMRGMPPPHMPWTWLNEFLMGIIVNMMAD